MKIMNEDSLELEQDELDLLVWSIANEVINGFKVVDFERGIGSSLDDFKHMANKLRALPNGEGATLSLY